jgi:hypothetical protein
MDFVNIFALVVRTGGIIKLLEVTDHLTSTYGAQDGQRTRQAAHICPARSQVRSALDVKTLDRAMAEVAMATFADSAAPNTRKP